MPAAGARAVDLDVARRAPRLAAARASRPRPSASGRCCPCRRRGSAWATAWRVRPRRARRPPMAPARRRTPADEGDEVVEAGQGRRARRAGRRRSARAAPPTSAADTDSVVVQLVGKRHEKRLPRSAKSLGPAAPRSRATSPRRGRAAPEDDGVYAPLVAGAAARGRAVDDRLAVGCAAGGRRRAASIRSGGSARAARGGERSCETAPAVRRAPGPSGGAGRPRSAARRAASAVAVGWSWCDHCASEIEAQVSS